MSTPYRILMLEDTHSDAELIVMNLQANLKEFEYHRTEDRETYIRGLYDYSPDIVISDYGLPSYTGLAAYADMKRMGMDIPFVMVTGSLPDEVAVDCLKAGIDDYVLKDRLSRLPEAVLGAIHRKNLERERESAMRELLRSRQNLETAEAMAGMGNWEWDIRTDRVLWSKNLYSVMGVNPASVQPTREAFFERVHPDDRHMVISEMDRILKGWTGTSTVKCRIVTPQGEIKMVEGIYSSDSDDPETPPTKMLGTMQDVTTQFLTLKALSDLTEELEQRVSERTSQLSEANEELERKNMEITDSLRYAKMIQQALLSDGSTFREMFPDSFVIWMPKDIVSGDFYWYHHMGDTSYVAAVDCTGHGVPGALMAAIGHQLLDRIIHDGHTEPHDVLQELDKGILKALHQETGLRMQDGMDMALCRIERSTGVVCFSGALRPLYIHSQGAVTEIPGTRQSVGDAPLQGNRKLFGQQCVKCSPGDVIYLTSDGYASQFGGPNGKKLTKKMLKVFLSELGHLPMDEQRSALKGRFIEWQGTEEQVDDVLIIGIRL